MTMKVIDEDVTRFEQPSREAFFPTLGWTGTDLPVLFGKKVFFVHMDT